MPADRLAAVADGAMNYLLDTDHWSSLQRNHPAVVTRLQSLSPEARLYMPVVAQAELLAGVEWIADDSRQQQLRALHEQAVGEAAEVLSITSQP